jgi:serine/threonine-protein kinase ULK4
MTAAGAQVNSMIVANGVIEDIKRPHCSIDALTFAALSAGYLNSTAPQPELETHLGLAFQSLASGGADDVNAQMNVLAYLHSLAHVPRVADTVINSALLPLLLDLVRRNRSSALRTVVVTLLGLLVRHATIVVPNDEFVVTLADLTREASPPLRRRAVAALGELLFYIATQGEDEASVTPAWTERSVGAAALVASLADSERDDTVKHYAARTIENTLAQASCAGRDLGLASDDVRGRLVALFVRAPELSPLRAAASTALAALHAHVHVRRTHACRARRRRTATQ